MPSSTTARSAHADVQVFEAYQERLRELGRRPVELLARALERSSRRRAQRWPRTSGRGRTTRLRPEREDGDTPSPARSRPVPGDEVLTTEDEYALSTHLGWRRREAREGTAAIAMGRVTDRTRIVSLSHVASPTGAICRSAKCGGTRAQVCFAAALAAARRSDRRSRARRRRAIAYAADAARDPDHHAALRAADHQHRRAAPADPQLLRRPAGHRRVRRPTATTPRRPSRSPPTGKRWLKHARAHSSQDQGDRARRRRHHAGDLELRDLQQLGVQPDDQRDVRHRPAVPGRAGHGRHGRRRPSGRATRSSS